ncbi:hypothetical protein LTR78_000354 [Recurvomyces mirabilis]|uniref:Uncharacterized protein n=1 Tax=Recurvomyces mirabilis TaxID=574656 RepID=A0AAE0WX32_9PEZI|nr:hypothetical protein LTR78_000354 [Recurvomyces mirabilis]KAK5162009.1 hypothetical protein LTS14_000355 [Recurvomyces mirabilis]
MTPLTPADSPSTPRRPSQQAIAFAISVVLSKSEGLSVQEYIRLLRQHIAKGRRENAISSVYRHLDRSSYWRGQYECTKDALRASEGSFVDLQREIEHLKSQLESAKQSAGSNAPKKRKKFVDEDVILVPGSPKRAKRDTSPARGSGATEVSIERDFDFTDVSEIGELLESWHRSSRLTVSGNILMHSLFQMHAVLKGPAKVEPAVLARHLIRTASALPQVMQQAVVVQFASEQSNLNVLKSTLNAAARATTMLIVGVTRLSNLADSIEVHGQVIYACVHMFANLLDLVATASAAEMRKADQINSVLSTNQRPTTSKGKTKTVLPKQVNLKDVPSLNAIVCFLCGIPDLFDPKSDLHRQLFEGFAYCLLNKLGSRLYACNFGRTRGPSIADEIEDQPATNLNHPQTDKDVRQAKLEAPYLIHILSRLMAAAPSHLGSIVRNRKGKTKSITLKNASKANLAIDAKEKLQRTLIICIFGTEGVSAEDPLMDCLKMPGICETSKPLPLPKVKAVDVQEWFKEEVWRIVGWEILGQEDGW